MEAAFARATSCAHSTQFTVNPIYASIKGTRGLSSRSYEKGLLLR